MSLYIFNVTKCFKEVSYCIPGEQRPFMTKIMPGGQAEIYPGGTSDDHNAIVEQLKPFGLVALSEIDRAQGFIDLAYQFGKPIKAEKILPVYSHNDGVRNEEGRKAREITVAAADDMLARTAQETGETYHGVRVTLDEQGQKDSSDTVNEIYDSTSTPRRGRPRKTQ